MNDATIPTMFDYIDFGVRAGLSMNTMLKLYREGGGSVRTLVFAEQYKLHKAKVTEMQADK